MILKTTLKAAVAAAALTLSVSGAQAQYFLMPPAVGGSAVVAPYNGYYGGATVAPTPIITFGAPSVYSMFGYDLSNYGFGYDYAGTGYNGTAGYTGIGDVNNPAQGAGQTVNGTLVQGGVVDPTSPGAAPPVADETADGNMAATPQAGAQYYRSATPSAASLVSARRGPYNRVAISYKGSTNGVASITMMLLDRRQQEVQETVVTSPPAQALLRRPATARYYRVVISYNNGTERTITRPLNLR